MQRHRLAVMTLLFATALPAAAAEWYRYINEDGVVVLSQSIPPALVHKGYTVLGDDGKVKRVVPREPTAAERAALEAEEAARRRDQALLTLYSSAQDVEQARDSKLRSIDSEITRMKGNMERLRIKKTQLEAQGAARERAGQPPSPEIVENLEIVAIQIREGERDIEARQQEKVRLRETFEKDLERVRELRGDSAGPSDTVSREAETPQADAAEGSVQAVGRNTAAASSGH